MLGFSRAHPDLTGGMSLERMRRALRHPQLLSSPLAVQSSVLSHARSYRVDWRLTDAQTIEPTALSFVKGSSIGMDEASKVNAVDTRAVADKAEMQAVADKKAEVALRGFWVVAATAAVITAPVVKWADANLISFAVLGCAIGVQMMIAAAIKPRLRVPGILMMLGCLLWSAYIMGTATEERSINQRRCLLIEQDMLSPKPKRENVADVFQALQCEPQPKELEALAKQETLTPSRPPRSARPTTAAGH